MRDAGEADVAHQPTEGDADRFPPRRLPFFPWPKMYPLVCACLTSSARSSGVSGTLRLLPFFVWTIVA